YDNVWANDAVQAARLGLGDDALEGMKPMLLNYQSYPNGMTNNTNGVFEYLGVQDRRRGQPRREATLRYGWPGARSRAVIASRTP
ncbi:MAG TPA: hypothetical protein VK509_04585, partial [Polyangiales bacterium]|nr:hypothetical protein [Polyangiales bacterium]